MGVRMMEHKVSKGTIYYESIGEGLPLIFLHSMGTDHTSMKAWAEPIFENRKEFKRIYVDIPAHGHSHIEASLRSTDDILSNILDFIDDLFPYEGFLLVGHSYGGYLAQGIMHYRLDRVKGICLIASALHVKDRTLPEKVVFEKEEYLLEGLENDLRTAFETLMIYQNKQKLELFLKEIHPGRLLANRKFLNSNWRKEGYYLREKPFCNLSRISQPALIIAGKHDAICGYKDYLLFLDLFTNSSMAVLDGAGHLIPIDKRETVQVLIKDWLEQINNKEMRDKSDQVYY
jgi:pimeloyl-ACP methyl ester carboxylesterase